MPLLSSPVLLNHKPQIFIKANECKVSEGHVFIKETKLLAKWFLTCFIGLFSKQTEEAGSCGYAETSVPLSPPVALALTPLPLVTPVLSIKMSEFRKCQTHHLGYESTFCCQFRIILGTYLVTFSLLLSLSLNLVIIPQALKTRTHTLSAAHAFNVFLL